MNALEALNRAWFLAINARAATPLWQIDVAIAIAEDLVYLIPALLAFMWLFGGRLQRGAAVRACCVTFLALGLNQLIGMLWMHPRPFMIGLGHTFIEHVPDSSFPSDHVTLFASVALTLLLARLWHDGLLAALAGVAVAWARVRIGVHFPLDMAGAIGVACIAYALVAPLWARAGEALMRLLIALYRKAASWPIRRGWLAP
ncbi:MULTISPECIES: phosphatase PAP2 family protein [unclassified Caballeronia]|uniref:phosphatase PAP2 family protein n=1 Tax=unclassified Caballeronia TaxID=2646786 RepID=UPI002028A222|nr:MULTISPECIES: phosphatase PAP2 family protein [unclassified Caballeronia]MDR5767696.1 phosphatase PAP2 family protein [Caballeronia sp. LZ028]